MIVKIQIALASSNPSSVGTVCLIYDETRGFSFQGVASESVLAVMNGRPKAFFNARINGHDLDIREEVPDQGW